MKKKISPTRIDFLNLCSRTLAAATTLLLVISILIFPQPALGHDRMLKVVSPWEIKSSDPSKSGYIFLRLEIIETLVGVDHDGNTIPCLATGWRTSEDGLEWRFSLREGVTFHDGTPMTPETVVNALSIAMKKPGMLKKAPIKNIHNSDGRVVISLDHPYAIMDSVLSHYSTCILAPSAYMESGEVKELIATGPYKVMYIKAPQELLTWRFKQYWGEKPKIKKAHYLAVARNETRGLMAQSADADIIFTLDPVTLNRLKKFKRISVFTASLPRTIVIKLNCALPGLDRAELRKALSHGLDRKGIGLTVMRMESAEAYQLFPESLGPWHIETLNSPKGGNSAYKKLMLARGWQENRNGYLEKDGHLLEMTLVTYSDRPELPVAATALQDQMRKMGIKLNVSITNSSAIPQGHKEGTLEMGLIARNYGLISNPLGTVLQDYGKGGGDWGAMNWENSRMSDLLLTLQRMMNPDKQKGCIREVSTLLNKEMPTIPVVSYLHTAATSKDVVNFSLDPLERSYRITDLGWRD